MVALLGAGPVASDALALAFTSETAPSDEYLYEPLREQIRRGTLQTLAVVEAVRSALDGTPADAWALRTELLVKLPWLLERGLPHGVQQVNEAGTLEEARQRGEAVLTRLDAAGPTSTWSRQQQVWLDLLVGRTEAGLAAARRLDREHGLVPLSEGDSAVLLLQARAAGEVDDALAWDVWRWVHGTDDAAAARVQALLQDPPRGSIVQAFACGELSAGEDLGPALVEIATLYKAEYARLKAKGVVFRGEPKDYGMVQAVLFEDGCGNLINLVQPASATVATMIAARSEVMPEVLAAVVPGAAALCRSRTTRNRSRGGKNSDGAPVSGLAAA